MITDFHFLRPWWLLAIIPALLVAWAVHRRSDFARSWNGIIADHLVRYLIRGTHRQSSKGPVILLLGGWIITVLVLAGPTWQREPSPFADDVAALAIVIKISPSMKNEDIAPTRMARSFQKIHDLLARRGSSKAALIAYAGSAHVVMPATTDAAIINTFAASLDPKIMPLDGGVAATALRIADQTLTEAGGGSILWITDSVAPEQMSEIERWKKSSDTSIQLLPPLNPSAELSDLQKAAASADVKFIPLTADDADIAEIDHQSKFSASVAIEGGARWQDAGYWLNSLLVLLLLPFFRKGWMPVIAARS